ncbi:MAG: 4-alpha-glucanotransferase, partial [Parafilimonas sp.]
GETICLLGNEKELGAWSQTKVKLLNKKEGEDFFSLHINLSKVTFPLIYKYGVYNVNEKKFMRYEEGNNRFLFDTFAKNKTSIINDGFALLPSDNWKAAGVAIPVFSLRNNSSCGVGEFADLKLLVDWAKKTGLQLIQILPVNATTAMKTWADSYPYAAISAFALHPMYLNLNELVQTEYKYLLDEIAEEKETLNNLTDVDYIKVNELKWRIIKKLYPLQKEKTFSSDEYKSFFEQNKTWLIPYAVFCFFRDKYGTADFNEWPVHKNYNEAEAKNLWNDEEKNTALSIYFFVQYHLHHQLKQAVHYAHENGVILKGDIPIGIYRYGADAWQHPELYHINMQAGAPPDDFAVKGQNWGFPTYNWEKMKENHFAWWKHRFEQMSNYFDAFRIDHILGFFRIWNIPTEQVEGIMGYFTPALTVHINEFNEKGIWFDYPRYCKPFITEHILWDVFRENIKYAKDTFLEIDTQGQYQLKPEFSEQHKVKEYFEGLEQNEQNQKLQQGLFDLISNVILFEAEDSQGQQFHFRFAMENTSSFQTLEHNTQNQLRDLYVNYFFQRQDWCWQQQAMQKLPSLKKATNMLICGEDLGLVPECVPEVMKDLGILSLEIQRMPKDSKQEFFHPNNAPYLSVVTPSTHDMSTIRGWWEEDHSKTERFFHQQLVQWGHAPYYCEDWINKAIVLQHLYSPAMWSIFLLQDLLGMNAKIRRENPHEERINLPSNPNNQWKYRMHISLEDLLNADEFNRELRHNIQACGRC